jgi:dolichyldiphosphatase
MPKYLQFTAVAYEEGDALGHALAWASMAPHVLLVAQLTALVLAETAARRRLALRVLAGQVANEGLNLVLKRVLREPRPAAATRTDYGMPSSHAQFVAYFLVVFCSVAVSWGTTGRPRDRVVALCGCVLALLGALSVLVSRVYLGYHSVRQVAAGWAVGVFFGALYSQLVPLTIKAKQQ